MKSVQDSQTEEPFGATSRTGEPDENFIMLCTDHGVEKRRQNRIGYTGSILPPRVSMGPPLNWFAFVVAQTPNSAGRKEHVRLFDV